MAVPSPDAFKLRDLQSLHVCEEAPRLSLFCFPPSFARGPWAFWVLWSVEMQSRPGVWQDDYVKQQEIMEASLLSVMLLPSVRDRSDGRAHASDRLSARAHASDCHMIASAFSTEPG